ncbi:MAG TPA: muconolactone Delta-isomerase family protein, partial [Bacteroidota bacterium]|nr:muconolactone Delta-isomerase family protein [Bacteroidota bacterium]
MHHYMIDISLPRELTREFLARVPEQRRQVARLLGERRLTSFSLALDRSKAWALMLAESEDEVRTILASFPLREFMKVRV